MSTQAPVRLRSACVAFYEGERYRSPCVEVTLEALPLENTHRVAIVQAARDPEVVEVFGDSAITHKAVIVPTGGPPHPVEWIHGRPYKAGEWELHHPFARAALLWPPDTL